VQERILFAGSAYGIDGSEHGTVDRKAVASILSAPVELF
jgi:hypothetical protein